MADQTPDEEQPEQAKEFVFDEKILENLNLPKIPYDDFKLRPLERNDYELGYLSLLSQLTDVGNVTRERFDEIFDKMKQSGVYYVTVIEDIKMNQIIGSATLFNEYKFIHGGCLRGRIEDVVVHQNYRGKKFGNILIETLKSLAKYLKCYKLTLDCNDKMIGWYKNLDFNIEEGRSNFMTIRFE